MSTGPKITQERRLVTAIPGPSALTMALVMSGLPTARFVFEGFLPRSGGERTERITQLIDEQRTVVLYEAPHRLERTLADLELACGSLRRIVLAVVLQLVQRFAQHVT